MKLSCCALVLYVLVLLTGVASPANGQGYTPWDKLTADWWIDFGDGDYPYMYPVNAADDEDISTAYPVSFVQAASGNKARGMNALKFMQGGQTEGHFVSRDKRGSFVITNTGDSNVFTDILLLIAIGTDRLANDFSMTVNLAGRPPYTLDASDFVYYDNPYGRPSGFYSVTEPNVEPVTYAFDTGMVTVYGISGVTGLKPIDKQAPYPLDTITVEYAFTSVPAPVVFSVYGYVTDAVVPSIYHTNRAFLDINNPSQKVSTFAVTVDGDLNGDLKVDMADFAIMSENWLTGAE